MKKACLFFPVLFLVFLGAGSVPATAGETTTTVAIVDFTNTSGQYLPKIGESAAEILSVLLVQTNQFKVVERDKLRAILQEQGLAGSGLVDNGQSAIQIGKLLGADLLITGSIVAYREHSVEFHGYGLNTKKILTEMTVSIKVLDVTSGQIVLASLFGDQVEKEDSGFLKTSGGDPSRILLTKVLQSTVNHLTKEIGTAKSTAATVEVSFISNPEGADLEINAVYYGSTPLKLQLNPGLHRVRISLAGYVPWEKTINAYEGLEVQVTLERKVEQKKEED